MSTFATAPPAESLKPGTLVSVRLAADSLYTCPSEIVEDRGPEVVVRFAAGNLRAVPIEQLTPATRQDVEEFEAGHKRWIN